jgi:hypothetical protein
LGFLGAETGSVAMKTVTKRKDPARRLSMGRALGTPPK